MQLTPFHLAVHVRDIDEARDFYGVKMGFPEGRSAETWIDFNMFGHQFVTHLNPQIGTAGKISSISSPVDGHGVPVPHYGVVMNFDDWEVFTKKVSLFISNFIIEPYVRKTCSKCAIGKLQQQDSGGENCQLQKPPRHISGFNLQDIQDHPHQKSQNEDREQ